MARKTKDSASPFPTTSGDHLVQAMSETYVSNCWQKKDTLKRQLVTLHRRMADGEDCKSVCHDIGLGYGRYMSMVQRHDGVRYHHETALKICANLVEENLKRAALGLTVDVVEQYGPDGELIGKQVRKQGCDVKAAQAYLKARMRDQYGDKIEHTGEIKYEPLAISVMPTKAEAIDAEASPVTKGSLTVNL